MTRPLFSGLLLCLLALPAPAQTLQQRQAELEALKADIAKISRQVEKDQREQEGLGRDLAQVEKRVSALRQAVNALATDIQRHEKKVAEQRAAQRQIERQLGAEQAALGAQLKAAYIMGRSARTRLLLSQQDPARASRLLQYFGYLHRHRSREIDVLDEAKAAAAARAAELARSLRELASLRQSREDALAGVQAQRRQRQAVLDRIAKRLTGGQQDLAQLRRERERVERLIDELGQAATRHALPPPSGQPFARQRGRMIPPLKGPTLARFQQTKSGGTRWNGLWLGAEAGTPVQAIADGRLVYVGWMHQLGLLLVVDHGAGYFSLYGHAGSASLSVGDSVRAGQQIAVAGDTGGHRQSGVYLEIRKGRKALNPQDWLAK